MKKKSLAIFVFIIFLGGIFQTSQAQTTVFNNFGTSIKAGNSSELLNYLTNKVSLNLDGKSLTANKNNAIYEVKKFIEQYPCRKFEISHTGDSGSSYFATGKYHYKNGSFRVKLLAKQENGHWHISEVDIK